jgi:shikimate kinase
MGSGKTTLGRPWAAALGRPFYDLDAYLAEQTGRTPAQWLEEAGEAAFRAAEGAVLTALLAREVPGVVATGGGTPCRAEAAEQMLAAGWTYFLDVPPAELARRLAANEAPRPLLQRSEDVPLETHLAGLLAQRLEAYCTAHVWLAGARLAVADLQAARARLQATV